MQALRVMNPWIAIVGARDARLALVERTCDALRERGARITGFVQVSSVEGEDAGFDLIDLESRERVALARPSATPRICNWGFDDAVFARTRLAALRDANVTILEVGRLEAAGDGHWAAVEGALDGSRRLVVVAMRPNVVASIALRLPDPEASIELPAEEPEIAAFVQEVLDIERSHRLIGDISPRGIT